MNAMAALKQYQTVNTQAQVFDASPHRLIQMLMEGGLTRLAQAKGAMERGQWRDLSVQEVEALKKAAIQSPSGVNNHQEEEPT